MIYHGKPVDNMPECILIDNSLNTDNEICHDRHVVVMNHLLKDGIRKLCNRAPKTIACRVKHIVKSNSVKRSSIDRIVQDCDKSLGPIWNVYQEKNVVVSGLANCN